MLLKKKLFKSTISILLVLLLTISCLPITVSATTLKIVDIEIEPITIMEYSNGCYATENNVEYYFYEPEYAMEYTVTFSDGTVIEDSSYYFYYNNEYYYFDIYTNQSYKNHWKAGNTYTMEVSIDNISVDVPVTITKSPVKSIEIEPITLTEYTNGYYDEDYNDKTDEWDLEYYRYSPQYEMEYTVTFTDGTVINGDGSYFEYNGEEYYLNTETSQSYQNQWTAGNTYDMEVSIYGYSTTVPVTITQSSIKSLEIEPISIIEHTNGYNERDYYEDDESSPLYYYYSIYDLLTYTITLKDGTVITGTGDYFENGDEYYSFEINTNQSYEDRWLAGNTYTAEIKMGKFTLEVPVTITKSPIVSIEAQPISINEGSNGYINTDYDDDMETPIGDYFYYEPQYLLDYVITFNDGTVIEDYSKWFEYKGESYEFDTYTDQSYYNQWEAGNTYTMRAEVMGYSVEVPVTITELPFESIEIEPVYITEGSHGHYISMYEDDEYIGKYYEYDPENLLEYTVTLKDGTVIETFGDSFEYEDEVYYLSTSTDQSFDNQWIAGNTYEMEISLGKLTVNVPVTITPSPIKSIELKPVTLIEFTDGYYNHEYNPETDDYDLEFFDYEPGYFDIEYTVTLKDGKVISGSGEYVEINGEDYWLEFTTNQSYYNQWTVGNTYTMEVSLVGVSTDVDVTIIKTPIKEIIVEPITLYKDINSYINTDYNPETDEFDLEYDCYEFENFVNFTIVWKDGTKSTHNFYDNITYNNKDYYNSLTNNQSYDTEWKAGNTYYSELTVLGKTVNIPITIKSSPVKSIEFIKAPDKTEYVLGEVIDLKGAVIRVNYTDKTYEDVEIENSINNFTSVYLTHFDSSFNINTYPLIADYGVNSITINFLGKEATTNISVKNKSVDSISLSGSGIDLTMEITYSDKTKLTAKVLDLDSRYGDGDADELFRGGFLITDKGSFNCKVTENKTTGDFYITLYLSYNEESKTITSNTVSAKKCDWWKLQNKIFDLLPAISGYTENTTSYNGKVTADNIDELLSVACSATRLYLNPDNYTDAIGNTGVFYANKVKASFNEIFGFEPNLSLSRNYDAENNTVKVKTGGFGGVSYSRPVKIEQTKDSIKVTTECTSYSSETYPMSVTFDKNFNLTAFDYSDTEEKVLTGDVNNDGIVNVIDATEIQKYLAGLVDFNDTQMKTADYNGDSTVSIIDATDIQKKLAGLI